VPAKCTNRLPGADINIDDRDPDSYTICAQ
jgi:hypothetical protein